MSNTETITLEQVLSRETMQQAWKSVKANKGAAGVDRKTIEQTQDHLKQHWPDIRRKIESGEYQPSAVRAVSIPKASGGNRLLGIPTVQDRLIQQALQIVMSAALDTQMSPHSYGFRPNRSAHDAVRAASDYVAQGKAWVVDIDLKSFFDQVNHDKLMHQLSGKMADKRILKLIGRYLRAPMRQTDGSQIKRLRGTPQGGPLSPLLANCYLTPLDQELTQRGIAFVRYADDIALFVSSERAAMRVLESVKAWLSKQLDLEVNDDKSGTGQSDESQLLGFRIHQGGNIAPSPKSIARFKERVRELWSARQSVTLPELRKQWQDYIRGWWNYFGFANWKWEVKKHSGWIRRHMRKYFWLRWHNRKGRYNALYRLGLRGRVLGMASSGRGAWRIAKHFVMQRALTTERLARNGWYLPWELAS
jgi:RNA-directed DNA polymerase